MLHVAKYNVYYNIYIRYFKNYFCACVNARVLLSV